MQHQTEIHWQQAQQVSAEQAINQQEKITEFLESSCELMDAADLQYYMNETGKDLSWIIANGKNINPVIANAVSAGVTLDELQHVNLDVDTNSDECEKPNLKLKDGKITVWFIPVWDNHYFIHVGDEYGQGYSYPDDETKYNDLASCGSVPHRKFIDFAIATNIIKKSDEEI